MSLACAVLLALSNHVELCNAAEFTVYINLAIFAKELLAKCL